MPLNMDRWLENLIAGSLILSVKVHRPRHRRGTAFLLGSFICRGCKSFIVRPWSFGGGCSSWLRPLLRLDGVDSSILIVDAPALAFSTIITGFAASLLAVT